MVNFHLLLILVIFIQHSSSSALTGAEAEAEVEKELKGLEGEGGSSGHGTPSLGPLKPADDKMRQIVHNLAVQIHLEVCTNLAIISYRTQAVSGTMYFVKVQWGNTFWHAKMHEAAVTGDLGLEGVQGPKNKDDPILYFP